MDVKLDEISGDRLEAETCRDDAILQAFIQKRISVNAWPIYSRPLLNLIRHQGLDLRAARKLQYPLESFQRLARCVYQRSRRVERSLGIHNAFHHTLHNFDVALRLLLLEWPPGQPVPEAMRCAAYRAYDSFESLEPVLSELVRQMLDLGVPAWRLARDLLASLGHDYGHSGGTDRRSKTGALMPLTHEDVAEKHIAKLGIEFDLPPAIILQGLAGIRATTLHVPPGREEVRAANDFERKMMLADVTGCVKRPDLWMTHVMIPVLDEQMQPWKLRLVELPIEIERLKRQIEEPENAQQRLRQADQLSALEEEEQAIITTVSQAFDNERRFLTFVRAHRLDPVPAGRRLWSERIDRRILLVERLLAREDLLEPLDEQGFPLVEEMTARLANSDSLERSLADNTVHPNLRKLFAEFIPSNDAMA